MIYEFILNLQWIMNFVNKMLLLSFRFIHLHCKREYNYFPYRIMRIYLITIFLKGHEILIPIEYNPLLPMKDFPLNRTLILPQNTRPSFPIEDFPAERLELWQNIPIGSLH